MSGDDLSKQDKLARACARSMWENDAASRELGMEIVTISQGKACLSMKIVASMTNGHKSCHGGYIFTLADSAFAFSCNGYNQITVAQHCTISFLQPAFEGDLLIAKASERVRKERSGIYDVQITNQHGEVIAEFRGNSRTVKGQHLSDPDI